MSSLYEHLEGDIASPLLGAVSENEKGGSNYYHDSMGRAASQISTAVSSAASLELDSVGEGDEKTCCPQILKSAAAILLAASGVTAAILCFFYTPVDPLSSSIWVYIMGGICLLNSIIVVKNEKVFLFTLPTSRRAVIELIKTKKSLEGEINSATEEIEVLNRKVEIRERSKAKLQGITEVQSSNVDELVQLVHENEETLELIRETIRQHALLDAVRIIITDLDSIHVINSDKAKTLANKIKVKMEDHGILLDEEKFLHALATNSTRRGAICAIKKLLSLEHSERSGKSGKDGDMYDMFYLPNNDPRQIGSVHAARAMSAQTHMSLSPSILLKQQLGDERDGSVSDSLSTDSSVLKRRKNRFSEQMHQFYMMGAPYFRETREGKCLFGTLVFLSLVNSAINVYFSYLIRDFWTALSEKEVSRFYQVMLKFVISMAFLIPLQVGYRFIRVKLGIAWRKWLTERVLKLYFANKVYYGLERQSKAAAGTAREYGDRKKEMDNPDQRIQEDVSSFTSFSLMFFLTVVNAVIDFISFSIILFSILPWVFVVLLGYASLGTLFSVLIGKVLIKLSYEGLQREADFRFSLVRIRENAESIAFIGGEAVEERATKRKFNRVIDNMTLTNLAMLKLDSFTFTYNHLANILPIFVLAQQYFSGLVEFGVIAQARQAFWHILDSLSVIINQFQGIAAFMASIDRLFCFMVAIQKLDTERANDDETVMIVTETIPPATLDGITTKEYDPDSPYSLMPQRVLTIKDLCLMTPDNKRALFQNLNLSLTKGQNLLITGMSGVGKSSLLRAIAGLWRNGDGEIIRSKDVYFLPQKPYCPPGSLRDQLLYPRTELGDEYTLATTDTSSWSDEDLLIILGLVDLPDLAKRVCDGDPIRGLNAVLDWSNTLSLGEQQRLAFGRLLVNRPRLIVMDESTSALDVVTEKKMYTMLKESLASPTRGPVTYVSVGHRPTLLDYHDIKLLLREGSGYASFIPHDEASTAEDQESILRSLQR